MEQLHIIDPYQNFPHEFDFSQIHYFHVPHWSSGQDDFCWIVLTGEQTSTVKYGSFYNEETGTEYTDKYVDVRTQVKAMIELQQSPYDKNEIWLKFFEVGTEFKNQGLSKKMIEEFVSIFKEKFPNKVLSRSSASEEGERYLKNNFTMALEAAQIPYKFFRLC
jgi:hypothetical protein